MIWFVCLKKSTEKFIKTNCRQLAAGVGWGENLTISRLIKHLKKHINLIINIMVRLFIKEATTRTSSAIEMFVNQTSCDLKGPCVMSKIDACTFNKKLI